MTDPLATLAAEHQTATHLRESIATTNVIRWDSEEEWIVDAPALAAAVLDGYTATWERDGNGLRRLVLTGTWETDPEADTR